MSSRRPLEGVEELYGTWKLVRWTRHLVDTGETVEPFGEAPTGFLSYGRDGRVSFMMTKQKRTRPSDLTKLTDTDRAELYNTIVAYGGTFTFDGQQAIHHVDIAWNEVWSGTAQGRNLVMDGHRLVMSTNPQAGINRLLLELITEMARGRERPGRYTLRDLRARLSH
jgi:Lipocalin-like domain